MTIEFYELHTKVGSVQAHGSHVEFVGLPERIVKLLNGGIIHNKRKLYPTDGEDFARGLLDVFRAPYLRAVLVN